MRFVETPLQGAFVLEPEQASDERGFFARMWCSTEFVEHGLRSGWVQSSISFNNKAKTLRGMHFQAAPYPEVKLVTCIAGAVSDVIVDVRPESPTFRQWFSVELSAENRTTLYVPEYFAHGFITLQDESVVQYHMSEYHHPDSARGIRWDDPAVAIRWALEPLTMNQRDRTYPDLEVPA